MDVVRRTLLRGVPRHARARASGTGGAENGRLGNHRCAVHRHPGVAVLGVRRVFLRALRREVTTLCRSKKRERRRAMRLRSRFFFVLYLLLVYYRNAMRAALSLVSATPRHRMVHLHEHLCTCAPPPKKNLPRPRRRRVLRGGFGDVLGAQPRRSRRRQHVRSLRERDGRVVEERQLEPRVFFRVDGELEPLHHRCQVHRRRKQRERASDATPRT
mmetsp:Transcript_12867/g.53931  ORF Transcript_12867/g.53931 Transcript_12867/m.53931 type:complete len:215 (+) Transcript_12867:792-1436(+)